jgi:hypothetical protein
MQRDDLSAGAEMLASSGKYRENEGRFKLRKFMLSASKDFLSRPELRAADILGSYAHRFTHAPA